MSGSRESIFGSAIVMLGIAVVMSGIAGCAVNESQEVAIYREVLGTHGDDHPGDVPPGAVIGVGHAMQLAARQSERLAQDGERYLRVVIDRRRAVAAFLPTLSLAPSYTLRDRTDGQRRSALDVPLVADARTNPRADMAGVRVSDERIAQERALLLESQDVLLLDVARTLLEVVRAEREVGVFERSIDVQAERVRDARVRRDVGLVSPLDVSLSESALADTRARAIEAAARVQRGRRLLEFLIGIEVEDRPLQDDLDFSSDPSSQLEWEVVARRWRGALAAAFAAERAAEAMVERAYGQYWPSVALDVRAFLSRQSEPSGLDWSSLFSLHLPLFSAGLIEADVREALSWKRAAQYELSAVWREIQRDVAIARLNVEAAADRTVQRQIDVRAARQALAQAEGLQDVGLAVNLERLEAQDRLLRAELDLVNAELDQRIFQLDLLRSVGRIHAVAGLPREPLMDPSSGEAAEETRRAAR